MKLTYSKAWRRLRDLAKTDGSKHLRELFSRDGGRAHRYSLEAGGLFIDYSKQRITPDVFKALLELAEERGVSEAREAMFSGEAINTTEDRAVLHTALRNVENIPVVVDGEDVMPQINTELKRMKVFANRIRSGSWRGATGRPVKTVVNIGIGGSYLGPLMATTALRDYAQDDLEIRFLSNIDGDHFNEVTNGLDPATTLFLVASKTFTTLETMTNAASARQWLTDELGEDAVDKHFAALSSNRSAVSEFGIAEEATFTFWDWVGGRYSLLSAIGLPLMIAIGPDNFEEIRRGAHLMDEHFRAAPNEQNGPLILALLGIWNSNFLAAETEVLVPYNQYLRYLPAYFQQASMESNGKSVSTGGKQLPYQTAPILWGGTGTDSQHSFFQLLHQGSQLVPVDFIGFRRPHHYQPDHHPALLANMLAQAEALAFGKTAEEVSSSGVSDELVPHKTFAGNKPSTTILADLLTPYSLGELIALYEHKIFSQGVIWGINSFDQMGVELGKELAVNLLTELSGGQEHDHDSSTTQLLDQLKS